MQDIQFCLDNWSPLDNICLKKLALEKEVKATISVTIINLPLRGTEKEEKLANTWLRIRVL
jgi:hypothetical protein